MKKWLKIIMVIVGIIILGLILDLVFIFTLNRPLFAIQTDNSKALSKVYKGILYDTYNCGEYSVPQIKLKGSKFSCSESRINLKEVKEIVDTTRNIKDFACAEALEEFYEDENYTYYYNCLKSKYIIVKYANGYSETVKDALKYGTIKIDDLDKFNIDYLKYPNEEDKLDKITMIIKEGTLTETGATIIITDLNQEDNVYGEEFQIFKNENNNWIELEPIIDNYGFNTIGYLVNSNNQLEMDINWEWLYGSLKPGEYRLVKKVYFEEEQKNYSINVDFKID